MERLTLFGGLFLVLFALSNAKVYFKEEFVGE